MKPLYTKTFVYFLSLVMVTVLVSCGTAQTVAGSDDGIYADDIETPVVKEPTRSVVAANKRSDSNYFTKELERLEDLKGTDIITDIESYKSDAYEIEGSEEILDQERPKTRITYNQNAPWGYDSSNSDVVVNINTFGGGWNTYGPFWDPYWDNWGWNNRWGWNNWGWNNNWRWNRWGWNNRVWHPYHRGVFIGAYDPFFCPPYYNYGYYGPRNRFYNYRRGANPYRRGAYGVASPSRRNSSYRRGANTSRRSSNVYRRGTSTRSSNRNSDYSTRRSTRSNNRSYTPSRRSTRSNNRSYTPSRTRGSNNRSYTPSRSSSSRSTRSYTPQRSSNRSYSSNRSSSYSSSRSESRGYSSGRSSSSSRGYSSGRSSRSSRSRR